VASDNKNADLFWGLRGAGQNFGIVTSFQVKVYDVPAEKWTIYSLMYTGDKLEALFDLVNKIDAPGATRDSKFLTTGVLARVPAVDANVSSPVRYTVMLLTLQAHLHLHSRIPGL
jgi:hypothetical protein